MKKFLTILTIMAVFFTGCDNKKQGNLDDFITKTDTIPAMCVELTLDTNAVILAGRGKPVRPPKPPKPPKPIDTTVTPTPPTPTTGIMMVMLDTDGYKASDLPSVWGSYSIPDLEPYTGGMDMVLAQIRRLYSGFYITFTTDEAFYQANSVVGKRVRCIITPTGSWYPSGSGVAYTGSAFWGVNIEEAPVFVFSSKLGNQEYIGDIVAHEVGHAIALSHQKDYDVSCNVIATYSTGKIMGSPFSTPNPIWFNQVKCMPQNDTLILNSKLTP